MNFRAMIWGILSLGVLLVKVHNSSRYRTSLPRYKSATVTAVWRNYDQLITYSQNKRPYIKYIHLDIRRICSSRCASTEARHLCLAFNMSGLSLHCRCCPIYHDSRVFNRVPSAESNVDFSGTNLTPCKPFGP
jgi:hypothetical protein